MSYVIYGPQGSGKTRHAEQLRQLFNMVTVIDLGQDCREHQAATLYESLTRPSYAHAFEKGAFLILTTEEPPAALAGSRHIVHIGEALRRLRHAHEGAQQ